VPAPFTHRQLEDAFWADVRASSRKAGSGYTFTFEGCEVRREAAPLRSNSRKSVVAWRSNFFVKPSEGEPYTVGDDREAPNRGNDPTRNWGLGRE